MTSHPPKFERKEHIVQVRFNQEHAQTPGLYWRVIVDGVEYKAKSVKILSPLETEEFVKAGEMKGNVFTRGWPRFDSEMNAVIQPWTQVVRSEDEEALGPTARVGRLIPQLQLALEEAAVSGKPVFAVGSLAEDGSGKLLMTINDPEKFVDDIALVTDTSVKPTEQDRMEYRASKLLSRI